jgi:hypothetical protein
MALSLSGSACAGLPDFLFLLRQDTQMSIFRRPDYTSDTTQFIDQLKAQHPQLEAEQRQGRSLLWEQQVDREVQQEFNKGRVQQKPYVYQTQA